MFPCVNCLSLGGFYRRNLCVFMHKMSQSWWVLQKLRRRVRWVSSGNMAAVTSSVYRSASDIRMFHSVYARKILQQFLHVPAVISNRGGKLWMSETRRKACVQTCYERNNTAMSDKLTTYI